MTDNGDETISDDVTGLMWQQKTLTAMTWKNAGIYCDELKLADYTDWRLPTVKELFTLVDYTKFSPVINTVYFPNTVLSFHWTSMVYINYTNYIWCINFYNGCINTIDKADSYYIRAVRNN